MKEFGDRIELRPRRAPLNRLVGNPFTTAFNCLDGEIVDHVEYACCDAFGDLEHPTQ